MASELRVDRIIPVNGVPTGGGDGVIQVVYTTLTSNVFASTSSFTDTGIEATITPIRSDSKILCMVTQGSYMGGQVDGKFEFQILRDSTQVFMYLYGAFKNGDEYKSSAQHMQVLDSPNTTSAVTYKLQAKRTSGSDNIAFYGASNLSLNFNSMTLMEVSG